jgi:hypothetical protein
VRRMAAPVTTYLLQTATIIFLKYLSPLSR